MTFGPWLREQRGTITQGVIARATGMHKGMVSALETGRVQPSYATLHRLAVHFGWTPTQVARAVQLLAEDLEQHRKTSEAA